MKIRRNSCGKFYIPQNQNCHRDKYLEQSKEVAEIILPKGMGKECVCQEMKKLVS